MICCALAHGAWTCEGMDKQKWGKGYGALKGDAPGALKLCPHHLGDTNRHTSTRNNTAASSRPCRRRSGLAWEREMPRPWLCAAFCRDWRARARTHTHTHTHAHTRTHTHKRARTHTSARARLSLQIGFGAAEGGASAMAKAASGSLQEQQFSSSKVRLHLCRPVLLLKYRSTAPNQTGKAASQSS